MKGIGIQLNDSVNVLESVDLKVTLVTEGGLITQGLVVGNTLNQNQALIIMANPGEFPFSPTLGVAIDELLLDNDYLRMRHRIREHLAKDGMKVKKLEFSKNKHLEIEAYYE
jgi:hypothetical protein